MNKHTPGPWKVSRNKFLEIKADNGEFDKMIAHVYTRGNCNGTAYKMPAEANATLMSFAPEMLECLRVLVKVAKESLPYLPNPGYGWMQTKLDGSIVQAEAIIRQVDDNYDKEAEKIIGKIKD